MFQLSPGHVLQLSYIKSRLRGKHYKNFLEVGSGTGYLSNTLLKEGLSGIGIDQNLNACDVNERNNKIYLDKNQYRIINEDFLKIDLTEKFDIIISSMVLEHLDENSVDLCFAKVKELLNENGVIICLVPSSPKDWGIEDEIAGHIKRYTFECFQGLSQKYSLHVEHISGLTFPLSNILLPISNYLVNRSENRMLSKSLHERTIASGHRSVFMKTVFPSWIPLMVNPVTMFPFYLLQRAFSKHKRSLVIYAELKKRSN